MKKILLLFLFLVFTFISPNFSHAASGNFDTSYSVSYNVKNDETTMVNLSIELKNKTSDYFASSYAIQTGFSDIENIHASDKDGNLTYSVKKDSKGTSISFKFNNNVVGINNARKFNISFDTKEVAKNYGSIYEVNIPGVANQTEYKAFNVSVNVPGSFGNPSFIKPEVKNLKQNGNSVNFGKNDLGEGGISIAYGENQIYKFNLKYHLYNKNLFPVTTEIAIPSNNNYQEIKIDDMNPKPLNVYIDADGNWMAKYRLSAGKTEDVSVIGSAKVSYKPRQEFLSESQKLLYLKPQKYWESSSPEIKQLADQLKTPEEIYKYIVENLKYDSGRVRDIQVRAGALGVLKNKNSAVCLEFTDLFIALSRASGIPAREVEGFGNTNNLADRPLSLFKDVLHTWPEYYDFNKKAWIMVDPTWGNTTGGLDFFNEFDFDHFAFVINGMDSTYPVPAGGYKLPGQENVQDVNVSTSAEFETVSPKLSASAKFSKEYLSGFPIGGTITITNISGVLAPNHTFNASSPDLSPSSQDLYFDSIPPYGKRDIAVKFARKPFLTNERDMIKITIGNDSFEKQITINPFYRNIYFYLFLGGVLIGSAVLFLSVTVLKSRHIHVS